MVASERWPETGLPPNPGGWITTTARNRAIDRLRREASRHDRHAQAALLHESAEPPEPVGDVKDDRLRLIFTCCHPALAPSAQVALTLRLLGGLETPYIARAFLVPEADDGQAPRPREAEDPRRQDPVPRARATPSCRAGCGPVLAVIYLVFNEGYTATEGDELIRADLCAEAIRLARLLAELMPDEPEALGLLALLLLTESRHARAHRARRHASCCSPTRTARTGTATLIAEGQAIVRRCLRRNMPGPYQIQAAINAVHSDAADRGRHRLGPDAPALRPAARDRARRRRRAQPRGRASPSSTARSPRSRSSTRSTSTPTTCSTPPAPSCSSAWAATTTPRSRTTAPSSSRATPPNALHLDAWRAAAMRGS